MRGVATLATQIHILFLLLFSLLFKMSGKVGNKAGARTQSG
jgi:hypothetical protein